MANPESFFSEDVRQHLSFIQGVINRMNSNSFSMKGWMVAIVSALCAVYASNANTRAACVCFAAAIIVDTLFCSLDAYYLKMEKQYRKLYNNVVSTPGKTDFIMDAKGFKVSFWEAIKSPSVWILYSVVAAILIITFLLVIL